METEPIGELSSFIMCGILFITSITLFVSAWMSDNRNGKISRIVLALASLVLLVAVVLSSEMNA